MATNFYHISGMHCVSCVQTIEEIIAKVSNVKSARVFFPLNILIIEWQDNDFIKNTKTLNNYLKTKGYSINQINFDEILSTPKKTMFNLISRLISIFLMVLLTHNVGIIGSIFKPAFGFYPPLWVIPLSVQFIGILLFILSFKYIVYMKNEIKTGRLGMGTFISLALILIIISLFIDLINLHLKGNINEFLSKELSILSSYAMILLFVEIGKGISEFIRLKFFREFLKSFEILDKKVVVKKNNTLQEKMVKEIQKGDIVILKAGETIYFDGVIAKGSANINESIITGESEPVFKREKDKVLGGSQNIDGILEIEVSDNYFFSSSGIIHFYLIKKLSEKTDRQVTMDKFLRFFIVAELIIIIIAIVYHINGGIIYALERAATVALLSCPCAFGIAVPLVLSSAYLLAFKKNILLKNPDILEEFGNMKFLILDKTGTITDAKLKVEKFNFFKQSKELLNLLYTIVHQSNHPMSIALKEFLKDAQKDSSSAVVGFKMAEMRIEQISGKGIKCIYNDINYYLGNFNFLMDNFTGLDRLAPDAADKDLYFFTTQEVIATFDFEEQISDTTKKTIKTLKSLYNDVIILSGDRNEKVKKCADQLSLISFYAGKLPMDKLKIMSDYKKQGKTIFVGDGINDALTIEKADIGVSLGGATDLAKNCADVILLDNNLSGLIKLRGLSRVSILAIKANILWAVIYNVIFIPLGFGIFHSIHISPVTASILMSGSSILLTINSYLFLRLVK